MSDYFLFQNPKREMAEELVKRNGGMAGGGGGGEGQELGGREGGKEGHEVIK